ncbi:MAG: MerR family transcriptional regulator [Proteobacteria bacterium]|nr:MerR family transcriptional regulator [Pseudomonadota bacterium]MDA0926787.1 MerR family transcriptional regulator [Pseudomonadota bacterium]
MVKQSKQWLISEFADKAGISVDTIRFYIKKGILKPKCGTKGGNYPYRIFSETELEDLQTMKVSQLLGMSLSEIRELLEITRSGSPRNKRMAIRVEKRRAQLLKRKDEIQDLIHYLDAKLAWIRKEPGADQPTFKSRN